jgi:hypothetical protein
MLSHGYGWHDLLRSRRHDSRGRWLQRLVSPITANGTRLLRHTKYLGLQTEYPYVSHSRT